MLGRPGSVRTAHGIVENVHHVGVLVRKALRHVPGEDNDAVSQG